MHVWMLNDLTYLATSVNIFVISDNLTTYFPSLTWLENNTKLIQLLSSKYKDSVWRNLGLTGAPSSIAISAKDSPYKQCCMPFKSNCIERLLKSQRIGPKVYNQWAPNTTSHTVGGRIQRTTFTSTPWSENFHRTAPSKTSYSFIIGDYNMKLGVIFIE